MFVLDLHKYHVDVDILVSDVSCSAIALVYHLKPKLTFEETSNVTLIIGFDFVFVWRNTTEFFLSFRPNTTSGRSQ